jgi:hypothetical protein
MFPTIPTGRTPKVRFLTMGWTFRFTIASMQAHRTSSLDVNLGESSRNVKIILNLHLVPRLRMEELFDFPPVRIYDVMKN